MMPVEVKGGEIKNSNEKLNQQQVGATMQTESKFIIVAKALDGKLDDYLSFTFSSEDFKNAMKNKFGGDINRFNQSLVLFALTLAHMEEAAKKDEELKNSLSSLQDKMKAVNENIEKIADELGYTVSQYSLDNLMDKDLDGVKETLAKDFGAEIKLETIFSDDQDVLKGLAELFAFTVNNYSGSVNVFMLRDKNKPEENAGEEEREEKQKDSQQILKQQEKQPILEQTASDKNKQNEEYQNPLRGTGKKIAIGGLALGVLGGVLFAGSMFYLPMAAFGLSGIGLAIIGFPLLFIGVVTWVAGLINEANYHAAQALKQAERKDTDEAQQEKKGQQQAKQPVLEQPTSDENKQK